MGLGESALILLGVGIISQRFGAGLGLEQLGVGIKTLAAAPLGGVGLGIGEFAGGLRGLAESLGDIGRGFGELFAHIPQLPPRRELPPPGEIPGIPGPAYPGWGGDGGGVRSFIGQPTLSPSAGGGSSDLLPGGGGSTPSPGLPPPVPIPTSPPRTPYYLTRSTSMTDDRIRNVMMI